MSWEKREAVPSNLLILGDAAGQVKAASGVLVAIQRDRRYENNKNFTLVGKGGEERVVAGFTSLNGMLDASDVGKFVKIVFTGWGKGPNGKYKIVDVEVFSGTPTKEMMDWLGAEGQRKVGPIHETPRAGNGTGLDAMPAPLQEPEDDDLPF